MRLRIGAHRWKVKHVTRVDIDNAYGLTRYADCLIFMATDMDPSQLRETLLHEVLHACFHSCGLDITLGYKQDEKVINRLSKVLLPALRDNPKLVDFLLED